MYDTVADVKEKNDGVTNEKKKNDIVYKCTMQLKNKLQKGAVNIKHVPTKEQVAYVLTKPLARVKFEYF